MGLTQAELARKAGCSRNHIASLETSASLPSLKLWLKLQAVLGL
ncbi:MULTISPECIES: helix-turn-helix transcriptional regulator [Methylomonas]